MLGLFWRVNRSGAGRAWKAWRAANSCLRFDSVSLRPMTPQKERRLFETFRRVFAAHRDRPFAPVTKGMRCGDGWFDLLWWLSVIIEKELMATDEERENGALSTVVEVKEVDGVLVFRMEPQSQLTDPIRAAIDAAITESKRTCEVCGGLGWRQLRHNMTQTLCADRHR